MSEVSKLLKEYLDYLEIEKNRSPKTRDTYERYLTDFIKKTGVTSPKDITESVVREYRLGLARRDLKKVTQSYYVIGLRNFLKYLTRREFNVLSPEKVEVPQIGDRKIEVLGYNELERLLSAPKTNTFRGVRDKAILETLFSTGLRVSELCALDRYVDLNNGELSVRGKGDKLRVVFFSKRARDSIKNYLDKRGDMEEALFISLTKSGKVIGRITPRAVQRLVGLHARHAGIPASVHPHQLRHQFATDLLINGADLRSVQELLGHANISTTQMYTHLTNKELREVHEAFHAKRRRHS